MLGRVFSACLIGIDAAIVRVEVDVTHGLPAFTTVGLPDPAIRESRERVRAAIRNSGFEFPQARVTVNLAPADLRKEGVSFDLPIALGLLAATGAMKPTRLGTVLVAGELALDGGLHAVRGALPMAVAAAAAGLEGCLLPPGNAAEAAVAGDLVVTPVASLAEAIAVLDGARDIPPTVVDGERLLEQAPADDLDFADVRGQAFAKRALEIAAAGGHHVLLIGPPGTGKTLLARRLPTILPALTLAEAVEVSRIWSVAGLVPSEGLVVRRPCRAPHHTVSEAGLIGGGRPPQPGEVSLAHRGVLLLDEAPEFAPHTLDTLRQPLEEGEVTIVRAGGRVRYPADIQLVGTMNPCRRGCPGVDTCVCTPGERTRYLDRLSGPLLDRIDLHVPVPRLPYRDLVDLSLAPERAESTPIRRRVEAARARQRQRLGRERVRSNGRMTPRQILRHCALSASCRELLARAVERLGLSARAHDRILKVARTIADLAGRLDIHPEDLAEALQYRVLDRAN